jgi:hypothetical protein
MGDPVLGDPFQNFSGRSSKRPPEVGTLIDPFKSTTPRARKPKEPTIDVLAAFEREDMRIAIWGKPYDGPVRNTRAEPAPKKRKSAP